MGHGGGVDAELPLVAGVHVGVATAGFVIHKGSILKQGVDHARHNCVVYAIHERHFTLDAARGHPFAERRRLDSLADLFQVVQERFVQGGCGVGVAAQGLEHVVNIRLEIPSFEHRMNHLAAAPWLRAALADERFIVLRCCTFLIAQSVEQFRNGERCAGGRGERYGCDLALDALAGHRFLCLFRHRDVTPGPRIAPYHAFPSIAGKTLPVGARQQIELTVQCVHPGLRVLAWRTREDQPVARARHGDVEKPGAFGNVAFFTPGPDCVEEERRSRFAVRPHHGHGHTESRVNGHACSVFRPRHAAQIRYDHNRPFESFGLVDR